MTDQKKNGYLLWHCICDCGNEIFLPSRFLSQGKSTSCGCIKTSRYDDLTGQRFGKLVVHSYVRSTSKGQRLWSCICDCGNIVVTTSSRLNAGNRKSCGCLSHPSLKDWIYKRFGDLTVISYDGKHDGYHFWKCVCTCGKVISVNQSNLKNGHTTSCGCKSDPRNNMHYVDGTCIEKIRNRSILSSNTSGVRGVCYASRSNRWVAQITFKGKN